MGYFAAMLRNWRKQWQKQHNNTARPETMRAVATYHGERKISRYKALQRFSPIGDLLSLYNQKHLFPAPEA